MAEGKFATSVSCMDGRIQVPLISWIKENNSVDYVDTITEPGVDKLATDAYAVEKIKSKVMISINAHGSNLVVISGHHDCAGNSVTKDEHLVQIKKWVDVINSWNLGIQIIGTWVNDRWQIEKI
ncbi:MAG: carbonic anhydrase [Nitrosopumilaceae archaeon]